MAVLELKGSDAQDDESAYGAWVDAFLRSKEATESIPALGQNPHLSDVQDVKSEAANWLKFKEITKRNSSNYYQNARKALEGIGPGTSLVFRLSGQRNFTKSDAVKLEAHLIQTLPSLTINVSYHPSTPRCVVHVGL